MKTNDLTEEQERAFGVTLAGVLNLKADKAGHFLLGEGFGRKSPLGLARAVFNWVDDARFEASRESSPVSGVEGRNQDKDASGAVSVQSERVLPGKGAKLKELRDVFQASGGRSVELAEEIDRLEAKVEGGALVVFHDGGELLAVDLERDGQRAADRVKWANTESASAGDVVGVAIPMEVVMGAPSLLTFVRRLVDGGHHAGEETALCAHAVLSSLGLVGE